MSMPEQNEYMDTVFHLAQTLNTNDIVSPRVRERAGEVYGSLKQSTMTQMINLGSNNVAAL